MSSTPTLRSSRRKGTSAPPAPCTRARDPTPTSPLLTARPASLPRFLVADKRKVILSEDDAMKLNIPEDEVKFYCAYVQSPPRAPPVPSV